MNQALKVLVTFTIVSCFAFSQTRAQVDTLWTTSDEIVTGEIKELERSVVTMETDYSDSDFKIDWGKVSRIHTTTSYLVSLSDGSRFNGTIESAPGDSTNLLLVGPHGTYKTSVNSIVFFKSIEDDFWSRLSLAIDFGVSLTKANNLRQFNTRSSAGYSANRWSADASYNSIFSSQDSLENIRRTDASARFRWYLPRDYYLFASSTFLSNSEQLLNLRSTPTVGAGKYIVHSNRLYVNVGGGLAWNIEDFEGDADDRNSLEGLIFGEVNLFNTGDFSLHARTYLYPSFTESGRFRADNSLDLKWDLPRDFYVKFGVTHNYDNRPTEGASETDYVFQWTVGWEL